MLPINWTFQCSFRFYLYETLVEKNSIQTLWNEGIFCYVSILGNPRYKLTTRAVTWIIPTNIRENGFINLQYKIIVHDIIVFPRKIYFGTVYKLFWKFLPALIPPLVFSLGQVTCRTADELPWLLRQIGDKDRLKQCILNLCIFQRIYARYLKSDCVNQICLLAN